MTKLYASLYECHQPGLVTPRGKLYGDLTCGEWIDHEVEELVRQLACPRTRRHFRQLFRQDCETIRYMFAPETSRDTPLQKKMAAITAVMDSAFLHIRKCEEVMAPDCVMRGTNPPVAQTVPEGVLKTPSSFYHESAAGPKAGITYRWLNPDTGKHEVINISRAHYQHNEPRIRYGAVAKRYWKVSSPLACQKNRIVAASIRAAKRHIPKERVYFPYKEDKELVKLIERVKARKKTESVSDQSTRIDDSDLEEFVTWGQSFTLVGDTYCDSRRVHKNYDSSVSCVYRAISQLCRLNPWADHTQADTRPMPVSHFSLVALARLTIGGGKLVLSRGDKYIGEIRGGQYHLVKPLKRLQSDGDWHVECVSENAKTKWQGHLPSDILPRNYWDQFGSPVHNLYCAGQNAMAPQFVYSPRNGQCFAKCMYAAFTGNDPDGFDAIELTNPTGLPIDRLHMFVGFLPLGKTIVVLNDEHVPIAQLTRENLSMLPWSDAVSICHAVLFSDTPLTEDSLNENGLALAHMVQMWCTELGPGTVGADGAPPEELKLEAEPVAEEQKNTWFIPGPGLTKKAVVAMNSAPFIVNQGVVEKNPVQFNYENITMTIKKADEEAVSWQKEQDGQDLELGTAVIKYNIPECGMRILISAGMCIMVTEDSYIANGVDAWEYFVSDCIKSFFITPYNMKDLYGDQKKTVLHPPQYKTVGVTEIWDLNKQHRHSCNALLLAWYAKKFLGETYTPFDVHTIAAMIRAIINFRKGDEKHHSILVYRMDEWVHKLNAASDATGVSQVPPFACFDGVYRGFQVLPAYADDKPPSMYFDRRNCGGNSKWVPAKRDFSEYCIHRCITQSYTGYEAETYDGFEQYMSSGGVHLKSLHKLARYVNKQHSIAIYNVDTGLRVGVLDSTGYEGDLECDSICHAVLWCDRHYYYADTKPQLSNTGMFHHGPLPDLDKGQGKLYSKMIQRIAHELMPYHEPAGPGVVCGNKMKVPTIEVAEIINIPKIDEYVGYYFKRILRFIAEHVPRVVDLERRAGRNAVSLLYAASGLIMAYKIATSRRLNKLSKSLLMFMLLSAAVCLCLLLTRYAAFIDETGFQGVEQIKWIFRLGWAVIFMRDPNSYDKHVSRCKTIGRELARDAKAGKANDKRIAKAADQVISSTKVALREMGVTPLVKSGKSLKKNSLSLTGRWFSGFGDRLNINKDTATQRKNNVIRSIVDLADDPTLESDLAALPTADRNLIFRRRYEDGVDADITFAGSDYNKLVKASGVTFYAKQDPRKAISFVSMPDGYCALYAFITMAQSGDFGQIGPDNTFIPRHQAVQADGYDDIVAEELLTNWKQCCTDMADKGNPEFVKAAREAGAMDAAGIFSIAANLNVPVYELPMFLAQSQAINLDKVYASGQLPGILLSGTHAWLVCRTNADGKNDSHQLRRDYDINALYSAVTELRTQLAKGAPVAAPKPGKVMKVRIQNHIPIQKLFERNGYMYADDEKKDRTFLNMYQFLNKCEYYPGSKRYKQAPIQNCLAHTCDICRRVQLYLALRSTHGQSAPIMKVYTLPDLDLQRLISYVRRESDKQPDTCILALQMLLKIDAKNYPKWFVEHRTVRSIDGEDWPVYNVYTHAPDDHMTKVYHYLPRHQLPQKGLEGPIGMRGGAQPQVFRGGPGIFRGGQRGGQRGGRGGNRGGGAAQPRVTHAGVDGTLTTLFEQELPSLTYDAPIDPAWNQGLNVNRVFVPHTQGDVAPANRPIDDQDDNGYIVPQIDEAVKMNVSQSSTCNRNLGGDSVLMLSQPANLTFTTQDSRPAYDVAVSTVPKITPVWHGPAPSNAVMKWLQVNGIAPTTNQQATAPIKGSGHSFHRFVANSLQSRAVETAIKDFTNGHEVVIVDVGAKYVQWQSIFSKISKGYKEKFLNLTQVYNGSDYKEVAAAMSQYSRVKKQHVDSVVELALDVWKRSTRDALYLEADLRIDRPVLFSDSSIATLSDGRDQTHMIDIGKLENRIIKLALATSNAYAFVLTYMSSVCVQAPDSRVAAASIIRMIDRILAQSNDSPLMAAPQALHGKVHQQGNNANQNMDAINNAQFTPRELELFTILKTFMSSYLKLGKVHYYPVRPSSNGYDQQYHATGLSRYASCASDEFFEYHPVFQTTLQQVDLAAIEINGAAHYIWMFDCHYYFSESFWLIGQPGRNWSLQIVGLNFPMSTGIYTLTHSEGTLRITQRPSDATGEVHMVTNGSSVAYTHRLLNVQNPTIKLATPNLQFIYHSVVIPGGRNYTNMDWKAIVHAPVILRPFGDPEYALLTAETASPIIAPKVHLTKDRQPLEVTVAAFNASAANLRSRLALARRYGVTKLSIYRKSTDIVTFLLQRMARNAAALSFKEWATKILFALLWRVSPMLLRFIYAVVVTYRKYTTLIEEQQDIHDKPTFHVALVKLATVFVECVILIAARFIPGLQVWVPSLKHWATIIINITQLLVVDDSPESPDSYSIDPSQDVYRQGYDVDVYSQEFVPGQRHAESGTLIRCLETLYSDYALHDTPQINGKNNSLARKAAVQWMESSEHATYDVTKVVKRPGIQTVADTIPIDKYYRVKEPPRLYDVSPELIGGKCGDLLQRYQSLYSWVMDQKKPTAITRKGNKISLSEIQSDAAVGVQTGYTLINAGRFFEGQAGCLQAFEWDSRSTHNQVAALSRQISGNTVVDYEILKKFENFVFEELKPLSKQSVIAGKQMNQYWVSLLEYPKKAFANNVQKQHKYMRNICQVLKTGQMRKRPYKLMAKSGEVQVGIPQQDGMFTIHDSRPRNICNPQGVFFSFQAAVQSQLWKVIAETKNDKNMSAYPWFLHGHTTEDLAAFAQKFFNQGYINVSSDGSQFDSTQYACLQAVVDDVVWQAFEPFIVMLLSGANCPQGYTPQTAYEAFLAQVRDHTNVLVMAAPGISQYHKHTDQDIKDIRAAIRINRRSARKEVGYEINPYDYMVIRIFGTTFSGDPTATTLGNTFRTGMYCKFIASLANIDQSVYSDQLLIAGDDSTMMLKPAHVQEWITAAESISFTAKPDAVEVKGLGQIVKSFQVSQHSIDFNSRWTIQVSGKVFIVRDYKKFLLTKQYYTKDNRSMLIYPAAHRLAIYLSLKAESTSRYLELLTLATIPEYIQRGLNGIKAVIPQDLINVVTRILGSERRYYQPLATDYQVEHVINSRLGLDEYDLVVAYSYRSLYAGRILGAEIILKQNMQKQGQGYKVQQIGQVTVPGPQVLNIEELKGDFQEVDYSPKRERHVELRPNAEELLQDILGGARMAVSETAPETHRKVVDNSKKLHAPAYAVRIEDNTLGQVAGSTPQVINTPGNSKKQRAEFNKARRQSIKEANKQRRLQQQQNANFQINLQPASQVKQRPPIGMMQQVSALKRQGGKAMKTVRGALGFVGDHPLPARGMNAKRLRQINRRLLNFIIKKFSKNTSFGDRYSAAQMNNPKVQYQALMAMAADDPDGIQPQEMNELWHKIKVGTPFMTQGRLHGFEHPSYDHLINIPDYMNINMLSDYQNPQGTLFTPNPLSSTTRPMMAATTLPSEAARETQPGTLITKDMDDLSLTADPQISSHFLASCIAPESGVHRAPTGDLRPTATSHSRNLIDIHTDEKGNGGVMIFPYAMASAFGSQRACFIKPQNKDGYVRVLNDSYGVVFTNQNFLTSFQPNSGEYLLPHAYPLTMLTPGLDLEQQGYTGNCAATLAGPLYHAAGVMEELHPGPQSFVFNPVIQTLEDQGIIESAVWNQPPNPSFVFEKQVIKSCDVNGQQPSNASLYQRDWANNPWTANFGAAPWTQNTGNVLHAIGYQPFMSREELRLQKTYRAANMSKNTNHRSVFMPSYSYWNFVAERDIDIQADDGSLAMYNAIPETYHEANITQSQEPFSQTSRMAHIPDHVYYLLITGAKPKSLVGTLEITFNAEFIPTAVQTPLSSLDRPNAGPETYDLIGWMYNTFPQVFSLQRDIAVTLSEVFMRQPYLTTQEAKTLIRSFQYPMYKNVSLLVNSQTRRVNPLAFGDGNSDPE